MFAFLQSEKSCKDFHVHEWIHLVFSLLTNCSYLTLSGYLMYKYMSDSDHYVISTVIIVKFGKSLRLDYNPFYYFFGPDFSNVGGKTKMLSIASPHPGQKILMMFFVLYTIIPTGAAFIFFINLPSIW